MKVKLIFLGFFCLLFSSAVSAQSLKDLLYSGKLKSDTGSVVRKTDDLATKIDTSTRKPAPPAEAPLIAKTVTTSTGQDTVIMVVDSLQIKTTTEDAPKAARDNDEVWKEYIDELLADIKRDVLPNRKIKDGSYSVLLVYEIDLDGSININTISSSPSNSFLDEQIRNRMSITAPVLTPLLNQFGKPRKAVKRQTITLIK